MTVENKALQETGTQAVEGETHRLERPPVYRPATDVYERDDALVVVADMPGVSEKDVEIDLDDDVLTLSGRAEHVEPEGYDALYGEFVPGVYERVFTLTEDVNREGIKATMKNGVLRVVLPKSEKARPRKITVQAE